MDGQKNNSFVNDPRTHVVNDHTLDISRQCSLHLTIQSDSNQNRSNPTAITALHELCTLSAIRTLVIVRCK